MCAEKDPAGVDGATGHCFGDTDEELPGHRRRDVRENAGECSPRGMVLADRKQPTGPIEVLAGEVLSPLVSPLFSARNPLLLAKLTHYP
jgi:hypothetical protein